MQNSTSHANKKTTGRKCSICAHADVEKINAQIRNGNSFRVISRQFWGEEKHHDSVRRHTENCLNLEIRALIKEKKIARAVNHYEEIGEQLELAKQLRVAAREYLSDEFGNITLFPRADEIEIVYSEFVTRGEKPGWVRRTDTLDVLLEKIESPDRNVQKIVSKHIDIRQFALNAIASVDLVLDKIAKVEGLYSKEKENDHTLEKVAEAYQNWLEDNPQATDEEKSVWLERFARGGGVDARKLAEKVGIQIIKGVH